MMMLSFPNDFVVDHLLWGRKRKKKRKGNVHSSDRKYEYGVLRRVGCDENLQIERKFKLDVMLVLVLL
jgi:hypothetical protein